MPTSAIGSAPVNPRSPGNGPMRCQRGFTLLEMMLVAVIMALAMAVVSFAVRGSATQRLLADALLFGNATAAVAAEALLSQQTWGMRLYWEGSGERQRLAWQWLVQEAEGWQPGSPADLPAHGAFAPGAGALLHIEGSAAPITTGERSTAGAASAPDIWLGPSDVTPFRLVLRIAGETEEVAVVLDELGRIEIVAGEARSAHAQR